MYTHDQIRKMLVDFALGEVPEQESSDVLDEDEEDSDQKQT